MIGSVEEYLRPKGVEECLLAMRRPGALAMAGGTTFNGAEGAIRCVVDLRELRAELHPHTDMRLSYSPFLSLDELLRDESGPMPAALRQAAIEERDLSVRSLSTIGGRLCRDRSDAALPTALLALGADVDIAESEHGGVFWRRRSIERLLGREYQVERRGRFLVTSLALSEVLPSHSAYQAVRYGAFTPMVADLAVARFEPPDGTPYVRVAVGGGDHSAGWLQRLPRVESLASLALGGELDAEGLASALRADLSEGQPHEVVFELARSLVGRAVAG